MKVELWREVTEIPEGRYYISNKGNLKNKKGRVLKPNKDKDGYHFALLSYKGVRKMQKYHRLVMKYFKGESDLDVNHKDGGKSNNSLDNLEYVTKSYNMKHAVENGLCWNSSLKGEKHNTSKYTDAQIKEMRSMYNTGNYTMREIARLFDSDSGYVCNVINNKIRLV